MKSKPQTVAAYIAAAPKESRAKLKEMRSILKKAAPKGTEAIKWGSLSISHDHILFCFAAYKTHVGFYPTPTVLRYFKKDLAKYKGGKGSVQFPLDKPLPTGLIRKMALYRIKEEKNGSKWM